MNKKKKKINKYKKNFLYFVGLASDLSVLLIQIKQKPRPAEWIAIGLKLSDIGIKTVNHFNQTENKSINDFIKLNNMISISSELFKYVHTDILDIEKVEGYGAQDEKLSLGFLGEHEIAFYKKDEKSFKYFCRKEFEEEVIKKIGETIWERVDSKFITIEKDDISEEKFFPEEVIETDIVLKIKNRIEKFGNLGKRRSVLIEGIPGSGKSTATKIIAHKLNLKTLCVNFTAFNSYTFDNRVIDCLCPDVLIIDDLDRVADWHRQEPIAFLERWNKKFKFIFVTVNDAENLADALLRPGRLDEHIKMNFSDANSIKKLLQGKDLDLVDEFLEWPLAYIKEFIERRETLGSGEARKEINEIKSRFINKIKSENSSENQIKSIPSPVNGKDEIGLVADEMDL